MPSALDLSQQVNKILEEYGDDLSEAIKKTLQNVGKEGVAVLKEKSAAHNNTGRYMKGWRVAVQLEAFGTYTVVLHNKTDWNLTHLLNNGFESVRHHKRIAGDGHIDAAEAVINEKLMKEVEADLK